MKVIKGEIYFTNHDDPTQCIAEVMGSYDIVEMTKEELNDWDTQGNDWVSDQYRGTIYHVKELSTGEDNREVITL